MTYTPKVLVITEDPMTAKAVKSIFTEEGLAVRIFQSFPPISNKSLGETDLVISELQLQGRACIPFLEHLREHKFLMPFVFMAEKPKLKQVVAAMKAGAVDFLEKPLNKVDLLPLLHYRLAVKKNGQKKYSPGAASPQTSFLQGASPSSRSLLNDLSLVGPTDMSVLIEGESGTGKEFVARRIHSFSERKNAPFIPIDCGAMTKELAASELFGHVKGSFTGAYADKAGQFEEARGGTLFLDEIGNLSYETQVKLLRALQEKRIRRVGGTGDIAVDIRLLTATNEDLTTAIAEGRFRADLYHRINEFNIFIPPLREKPQEVEQFAFHFLEMANRELNKNVGNVSQGALQKLKDHHWPGNLRELKNIIKRAVLVCGSDTLEEKHISLGGSHPSKLSLGSSTNLKQLERSLEKEKIVEVLLRVHYNKTKAAQLLNIDRKTLYNKIKEYQLKV